MLGNDVRDDVLEHYIGTEEKFNLELYIFVRKYLISNYMVLFS